MKTLIINASPHKNGNTSFLVKTLSEKLKGHKDILFLQDLKFTSCRDCGKCQNSDKCILKDPADEIINSLNDYDNIVLATPLYYNQPVGEMLCFLSRFQLWFLSKELISKAKNAAIIVSGGGDCIVNSSDAEKTMRIALRSINAKVIAYSRNLHTSETPACKDKNAILEINEMAEKLNAFSI